MRLGQHPLVPLVVETSVRARPLRVPSDRRWLVRLPGLRWRRRGSSAGPGVVDCSWRLRLGRVCCGRRRVIVRSLPGASDLPDAIVIIVIVSPIGESRSGLGQRRRRAARWVRHGDRPRRWRALVKDDTLRRNDPTRVELDAVDARGQRPLEAEKTPRQTTRLQLVAGLVWLAGVVHPHTAAESPEGRKVDGLV
jgi:hypothetical protein